MRSTGTQAGSRPRIGIDRDERPLPPGKPARPNTQDGLLEYMRHQGLPLTREKYIELATAGDTIPWTAEHEVDLPPELRRK